MVPVVLMSSVVNVTQPIYYRYCRALVYLVVPKDRSRESNGRFEGLVLAIGCEIFMKLLLLTWFIPYMIGVVSRYGALLLLGKFF